MSSSDENSTTGGGGSGGGGDTNWLAKRRAQVAKASRKVRLRKRQELDTLREENESLRKERTDLLASIDELARTLNRDSVEEVENRLLKSQLKQHALFLRSIMENLGHSPDSSTLNREIVQQTCEVADTEALRLLQRSQDGEGWSAGVRLGAPVLPSEFVLCIRHEVKPDGCCNVRIDALILDPNEHTQAWGADMDLRAARDLYTHLWSDAETFQTVFRVPSTATATTTSSSSSSSAGTTNTRGGNNTTNKAGGGRKAAPLDPHASFEFNKLTDFSYDDDADDDPNGLRCETQHIRETTNGKLFDWVFLNSIKDQTMTRSSLWCGPRVDDMLHPNRPTNPATPERKKYKRDVPVGVVSVARATRTVSVHSMVGPSDGSGERVQHHYLESIFLWEDTYGGLDETSCGRAVLLLSFPESFRVSNIGSSTNLIDEAGNVTQQFIDMCVAYTSFALVARNARVDEAQKHTLRPPRSGSGR